MTAPRLRAVPSQSDDRHQAAKDRRLALVREVEGAPKMRAIVGPDALIVMHCPACRHNGYPDRHEIAWDEVTIEPAPNADRRIDGERWRVKVTDPNIPWGELNVGLTDHQAAYAFTENARILGVTPQEREDVAALRALDDLNDPFMRAEMLKPGGRRPSGGDAA